MRKKSAAPNKLLLAVLGVVIALALAFKLVPSLVGGGAGVSPLQPLGTFHLQRPGTAATTNAGSTGPVGRPARDPFGAPPGFAAPGH
jgi:hypothetical protein